MIEYKQTDAAEIPFFMTGEYIEMENKLKRHIKEAEEAKNAGIVRRRVRDQRQKQAREAVAMNVTIIFCSVIAIVAAILKIIG